MGRRTSFAALAGKPVEDVPGASAAQSEPAAITAESAMAAGLTIVQRTPLAKISPTPLNSRRDFGSGEELAEFGESLIRNQLQAVVVVPRDDYLKLWPGHADSITGEFVLAAGERRWRGVLAAGGDAIDTVIRPEIAETQLTFLDVVFTENFARKNLDYIEEANAIEELVKVLGTARAVAEYYKKTEGWASQRRSLLKLTLPMQRLVSSGELPLAVARDVICKLPAEEQESAWLEWKNAPAVPRKARSAARAPQPSGSTPANSGSEVTPPSSQQPASVQLKEVEPAEAANSQNFTAVKPDVGSDQPASAVPSPRGARPVVISVDLADIQTSAKIILEALSPRESYALVSAIVDSLRDDPDFAEAG